MALALVPDLSDSFAPDADVVVATAWQTAAAVSRWRTSRGRKLCLVADFEHWSVASDDERAVIEHAFADLEVVAYGPAVRGMLASFDRVPVAEIRVGVDGEEFGLDNAVPSRPAVVGFPVREEPFKGSWDAIAAASLIHLRRPDVHLCAFGRGPLGFAPQWLTYHVLPTNAELRRMYNNLAVFVHPSHYEAWPLPPMEAMICGASVVAADSIGVRGYARDGHNATIVPPGRPDLLAAAVCDLLADEPRRSRLAEQGRVDADRYQWKDAVTQLETVIREACEGRT